VQFGPPEEERWEIAPVEKLKGKTNAPGHTPHPPGQVPGLKTPLGQTPSRQTLLFDVGLTETTFKSVSEVL